MGFFPFFSFSSGVRVQGAGAPDPPAPPANKPRRVIFIMRTLELQVPA